MKVYFRNGENGKDTKFYTTSTIDNVENARWDDLVEFLNYRPKTDQVTSSLLVYFESFIIQKYSFQYLRLKLRDADSITKDDHLGEVILPADSIYFDDKKEQTVYLENSGEHSSLTIIRA